MNFRTDQYRVLAFSGVDALAFLQSQLTNDVAALGIGGWQWQGYCSAKGRLLATFALARIGAERFEAVVPTSTVETLGKRLMMFRLRSKLTIEIAADKVVLLTTSSGHSDADTATANDVTARIALPDGRALQVVAAPTADALPLADEAILNAWRLASINALIPEVTAATAEMFVPQMIGWDTVVPRGGVSFSKGCYPGQEIVARAHHRGAVKRHLAIVKLTLTEPPTLGADVELPDQRLGQVCNFAADRTHAGGYTALVVLGDN